MTPALEIPALTLPFPVRTHPAAAEIDDATVRWLLEFGLVRDAKQEQYLRAIGLGRWFPSLLPDGATDRVLLGSQLTAWFTVLDDQVAEKSARAGDAAALMRQLVRCEDIARMPDAREEDAPLQRALVDLSRRLRAATTPEQLARLQWYSLQYYLGIASEAVLTVQGAPPDVDDYRRIRRLNACIPPFFVMSEVARGWRLPLGPLLSPAAQTLTALAVDLTAVVNDIIGLPRDLERGDAWGLTHVLARDRGLDVRAGLDVMVAQFRGDAARFAERSAAALATGDEALARYVEILQDLVAGHLAWTKSSPRYHIRGWH